MMKNLALTIVFFLSVIYTFSVLMEYNASRFDHECQSRREDFQQLELNGIVFSKYLDEQNHLLATVRVNSQIVKLSWNYAQLYDHVEAGDSLYKLKGRETVIVVRGEMKRQINLAVNCEKFKRPFSWRNTFRNFTNFFPWFD